MYIPDPAAIINNFQGDDLDKGSRLFGNKNMIRCMLPPRFRMLRPISSQLWDRGCALSIIIPPDTQERFPIRDTVGEDNFLKDLFE